MHGRLSTPPRRPLAVLGRLPGGLAARAALAAAAGALAATGFAPLSLWPVTLAAVVALLALLAPAVGRARHAVAAALIGWSFGVGHFTVGNYWIATAFTHQAQMPAWLGSIAVVLLALYLAVYPALAAAGAVVLAGRGASDGGRGSVAFVLAFAGCWTITEWLRAWVFTGFAWNPLGMVALGEFARPGLASLAPWLGTYALSGLVVLFAGFWALALARFLPVFFPDMVRRHADIGFRFIPKKLLGAGLLVALPIMLWMVAFSARPDARADERGGTQPFTLVQPLIPQPELNDPAKWPEHFRRAASLSRARQPGERRLVLWPESAVPDYLRAGYPRVFYENTTFAADPARARARLARATGPGSLLLTGAVDLVMEGGQVVAADNAVTAIDDRGRIVGGYRKAHLVPYGEYLPMRGLLEPLGLSRLVAGTLDFRSGPGPRTLDFGPWGSVGFQLCYEIIFSGQVVDPERRPDVLFNPSNDGWFGAWGPPQHLAQARMRAIEEGLPVLRATTSGISAVIDARGVVREHLPTGVAGRIDGRVPPALAPTLFARLGNALPLGWAALLLVLAIALRPRRG